MLKRSFDIFIALFGVILTLPVMIMAAIMIKITSKGPIIYKQTRIGRCGGYFTIYKFRTMVDNAYQSGGISIGKDPRITRIGYFLRLSKLDELPQFFNVLKGDMSIIGPRPEIPEVVKYYTYEQRKVLYVRPGILGPAQIIGRNEDEMLPPTLEDPQDYYVRHILPGKLAIDLQYVQNSDFLSELKLLAKGLFETIIGFIKPKSLQGKTGWPLLFIVDLFLIVLSYSFSYSLRFDWIIPNGEFSIFINSLPIIFISRLIFFYLFRLYDSFYKYISIRDILRVTRACSVSTATIIIAFFFLGLRIHSRSILVIDWFVLMMLMSAIRVVLRLISERNNAKNYTPMENILIVGAGDVGEMLTREISKNGHHARVVGFVDDNPAKVGSSIHGVQVFGNRKDIPDLVKSLHVDQILIAIDDATPQDMGSILNYCEKARVKHYFVPAVKDLVSGNIQLSTARDIDVSDIIGRRPLELDFSSIKSFIAGKRILVTGAGGSIGSELCRQVIKYDPESMILVDRNENYIYELEQSLKTMHHRNGLYYRIMDMRNSKKLERIFIEHRPQIVFHAAALKHVPLCETNVDEAVSINIWGTRGLLLLAHKFNVESFVMISTDKAVNPTNVMGTTKRIAELYVQAMAGMNGTHFQTVRFGNVLNSNGSVVPLFMKQIANGGPVSVTHPEVERYFMSINEAVQLVIQAASMGNGGEIFVLDMGERLKIIDIACELIRLSGLQPYRDIEIKFIGLRPGEKIIEELIGLNEIGRQTTHNRIQVIQSTESVDFEELERKTKSLYMSLPNANVALIRKKLSQIVPEYTLASESHPIEKRPTTDFIKPEYEQHGSLVPVFA